jgi:hypothetical protein
MSDFGFSYDSTQDGQVFISWEGRVVVTLRGARAQKFLSAVENASPGEEQHVMARFTGNFKRGNEKRPTRRDEYE